MGKKQFSLAVIVGARPNFIKVAPLFRTVADYPQFKLSLIHTGQHYDRNMSDVFLKQLKLPEILTHLQVQEDRFSDRVGKMRLLLLQTLKKHNFDSCIVVGDVDSTLAGALAAKEANIPLIHIEAGLRSFDRRMPEETNRVVIDHLSDILFTTEDSANTNLSHEGIHEKKVFFVGNLMIETLQHLLPSIAKLNIHTQHDLQKASYVVATIHRDENCINRESMKKVLHLLKEVSKRLTVIIPLHPRTKKNIEQFRLEKELLSLKIIEPQGYFEFLALVKNSCGVITDSGGIQEETSFLGIPCITLRENTERPVTITLGTNKLSSLKLENHTTIIEHFIHNKKKARRTIPLWDNKVSKRIFEVLNHEIR